MQDEYENLSHLKVLQENHGLTHGNVFDYYVTFINLLSDLCMDRNFKSINPTQEMFSLDTCYQIMSSNSYAYELRSAFAQLTLTCWVDGMNLDKIDFPNYLRTWKVIPSTGRHSNEILCNRGDVSMFNRFKDFIVLHMQQITKSGYQRAWESDANEFTEKLLTLAMSFVEYGLYKSVEELNRLLQPLLSFLNASMDVNSED